MPGIYGLGSASIAYVITPSDVTILPTTRGIYIGGDGNLTVTMESGADCDFPNVKAGTVIPIRVTKVKAATTATGLRGLYGD